MEYYRLLDWHSTPEDSRNNQGELYSDPIVWCETCKMWLNGQPQWTQHREGKNTSRTCSGSTGTSYLAPSASLLIARPFLLLETEARIRSTIPKITETLNENRYLRQATTPKRGHPGLLTSPTAARWPRTHDLGDHATDADIDSRKPTNEDAETGIPTSRPCGICPNDTKRRRSGPAAGDVSVAPVGRPPGGEHLAHP